MQYRRDKKGNELSVLGYGCTFRRCFGALLVIYAAGVLKDKEEFRATIALIWLTIGCYITGIQFQAGHFNSHVWFLLIAGIIPVFAGTWIGTKLVKKLPQEIFMKMTYILLLLSGVMAIV